MKSFLLLIFIAFLSFPVVYGQDLITKVNGEQLQARIIRVTDKEVRCAIVDSAFSLPNAEVFLVKYADGEEKVITPKTAVRKRPVLNTAQLIRLDSLQIAGRTDAEKHYKGYRGASTGTLVATAFLPPLGLITAIGASSADPRAENLNYPDEFKFENHAYAKGYRLRAKKIKQRNVWNSFGLGCATGAFLYYMVLPLVTPK